MLIDTIVEKLFSLQDTGYRDFQSKLFPNVPYECFIGVRTPDLKALARQLAKEQDISLFLDHLPHKYFDEDQLHVFIISGIKDFGECMRRTEQFLPFIDNWATCDQFSPAVYGKHKTELLPHVEVWLGSSHTYTARFGIVNLMRHYLDGSFDPAHLEKVRLIANGNSEYYVRMAAAWYYATAFAKQYEPTLSFLMTADLDSWTKNKSVQKAVESRRLTPEQKDVIRSLRVRETDR